MKCSVACVGLLVLALAPAWGAEEPPARPLPRGYSIPLLDLAGDTSRQVVVDREAGQYLGHPTTVLLEDGKTMLAVYPKGHGRGAIVLKRSTDGGRTWSERLPTPASWATSQEVPTLHRVIDPQGKKRLILFSGLYPIRMAVSEDDGHSWSELRPIGDFGGIVTMASVERLKDGRYLALFHDDGRFLRAGGKPRTPPVFVVYQTVSSDGGLTWAQPVPIATHPQAHLCEPGLVRSPDGKQLAVLLRENSRKRNSFVIFSDDEGQTWSPPRELPGALTGDRHVGRYAPDGRLVLTFRDTTLDSPTRGDWVAWVGTYDDLRHGREGQYRVRLLKNHKGADCAYPGLELLPDGTFVTTTYGHWVKDEPPFVVSVRFTLRELDERGARARPGQGAAPLPAARAFVVGHRGLPLHAPENTLAGFAACLDLRLGFELDIRRTRDGHLVCVHDDDVQRTTNGKGKVADLTLADLRGLDAGGWFDPAFAGERVPTLAEAFTLLRDRGTSPVLVALDFKCADATVEADVVRLARTHGVMDRVVCIGRAISEPGVRRSLRQADARMPVAVLAQTAADLPAALADRDADWAYLRFVPTPQQVAEVHRAGKRVFLAGPTVAGHEPAHWTQAWAAGVDAILTDYPLECRQKARQTRTP